MIAETLATLVASQRLQRRYAYDAGTVAQYCDDLSAVATPVPDPPPTPGAVPRDPDDDKIIACALAAGAEYVVSRDRDLLSLGTYAGIKIIAPKPFLQVVRAA
jgi:putative PIN family toxin of toxin-antitoxin system